ncbi:F-box/FBD/LRR-repeat protein At3g14710-like isoform X1 [Gastrolobium bilobum]|uniref:F-box/FBD/LRR-repeat protein At3g14710-like isoform X1 n=1 Tax=Gastrolobium bilobum TaxID=150636 RepID=UPI002AAFAE0C|nr:F-box/FBD/LRR-repeat protein At3g14710-like isoform X1 [Gastrolobium bilobum]XP_061369983.1 F-box/FBD/LRR-repeat protein At3g14710-like isoform X1 [Gastrolobium bilobum]
MDSSIATQNDETSKKFHTEQTLVDVEDIISKLHESTLGHILCFLPTIEAVRTCVLSRRWIEVWKSITSLQFNDSFLCSGKKMQQEQFVHFVNRVLLHLVDSSIQSFSLCLTCYHYDVSQVSAWISTILEKGVHKLRIQYADKVVLSSHSLFNCSSLVQLVLQMRCTLSVPIFASLPNLQNLSISGIKLVSESSTYSEDTILSFPVLKVFEARGCEWSTMQDISIQAPLLETFSIAIWNSQSNESCKSSIKIFGPHLTDFSYEGDLEQDIILLNPSSIRSASVVIVIDEDKKNRMEKLGFQAHMLLKQIHEVERLNLLCYKVIMHAKDIFTHLPAFGRLSHLQLNEATGEALLKLLHNSPNLNTLVLLNGVCDLNKDILTSASVPHCFMSSLKVFQFKGFNVHDHELCLVKFVMTNAAILERITISTAFWLRYSDIDLEKVKEQILSFPKCSSVALIEFSDVKGS